MTAFKRAITNIKRQPVKNGVLLLLILILATALSGAISVRQAINLTEERMLLRTPAVATLSLDVRAAAEDAGISWTEMDSEFWFTNKPSLEDITAVGNLPYVKAYDAIMLPYVFSQELEWAKIEIDEDQLPRGVCLGTLELSTSGMRDWGGYIETFTGNGVTNPDLVDINAGLIELIAGRTFTQAEIDNGEQVAIIPQSFALVNDLYVGATFELENIVHDNPKMIREGIDFYVPHWHEERFMVAHQTLEFEVIGIFDTHGFDFQIYNAQDIFWPFEHYVRLHNRIYMPISVADDILTFRNEGMQLIVDDLLEIFHEGHTAADFVREEQFLHTTFILYDPRDLDSFQDAAAELLPGFWEVNTLRDVNASLITSMDTIRSFADMILLSAAVASIIILSLIITLLLRDRRYEVGVYMALGEKRKNIIFQFLTEVILIATVATVIALFIGNSISAAISRNLFEQQLVENIEQTEIIFGNEALPPELILFNPGEASVEESLELYDTSLSTTTILTFVGVGVVVILLSTIIPLAYVVKLEPKQVLMS